MANWIMATFTFLIFGATLLYWWETKKLWEITRNNLSMSVIFHKASLLLQSVKLLTGVQMQKRMHERKNRWKRYLKNPCLLN